MIICQIVIKKKLNQNNGILFFITGLSGSGKTSISKLLKKKIEKRYGKTLILTGEKIRDIYEFRGFTKKDRLKLGMQNIKLINLILKQKINVIYDAVALISDLRKEKRKKIKNYVEIFINSNVKKIIKFNKKKKIYEKTKKNIMGIDIKPDFPITPDIKINNNFDKSIKKLSEELFLRISKLI